jgi:hypothetical protein
MNPYPYSTPLVAPQRPLPSRVRRAGVGMPGPLPSLLRFGPVAPPQVGGSRFTGGQVAQPQTSMTHPQAAQGFTPPHFNPANPTAPSLAPFVSTPQGGPPTAGPLLSLLGNNAGATPAPTSGPTGATPAPPPPGPDTAPFGAPPGGGKFGGLDSGTLAGPNLTNQPNSAAQIRSESGTGYQAQTLNLLLTLLAQSGQRLNNQNRYAA